MFFSVSLQPTFWLGRCILLHASRPPPLLVVGDMGAPNCSSRSGVVQPRSTLLQETPEEWEHTRGTEARVSV